MPFKKALPYPWKHIWPHPVPVKLLCVIFDKITCILENNVAPPLMFWFWLITTGSRKKALTIEAERLMRRGHYQQALDYYDTIAGEWPTDPSGFEGIGRIYHELGNDREAGRMETIAACLNQVMEAATDPEMQLKTAEAFVSAKLYNLALPYADKALRLAPGDLSILKRCALIFRHNRHYGRALGAVKQALRLAPLDKTLYEQMAICLKGLGRQDDSRRAFSLSKALAKVEENPDNREAMEAAIFHFTMAGAKNLGLQMLDEALQKHPDNFELNLLRGKIYLENMDLPAALQTLLKAVDLNPLSQEGHFLLSRVYSQSREMRKSSTHQEMAEILTNAKMNSDPMDGGLMIVRGLLKCNQPGNAKEYAESMFEQKPIDWRGPFAIGIVERYQGNLSEAITRMHQASKLNPHAPQPLMESAWILLQAKKADSGIEMARKAVAIQPRDPDLRRGLARVLRASGHPEMALEEEDMANTFSKRGSGDLYD